MFKKMLAFMLSMTTLASASPFVELKKITAEGETSELSNVQNDYEIKASNSIGNYINEQMQKHQSSEDNSLTIPTMTPIVKSTEVYSVTGLTFYTENGTVVIETSQSKPCIAKIRFMDEDSQKCLIETTIPVKTGELLINQTTVNTSDLSEYYTIECVLVDDFGKELCSPFVQDRQTKEMQEIIATDIYDFPEDKVICFSQSDNNDFIVLSDETIIAETTDDNNTLVSADYEKNVFIFENADESITDLKNGDYFYSQPNESDIIAVTVKNVSEDGDRVIIKGSDENFEEMVTFMKFESKSDASELMIDSSTADEDIVFEEEKLNNRDEGFQPVTDTMLSFSLKDSEVSGEESETEEISTESAENETTISESTDYATAVVSEKTEATTQEIQQADEETFEGEICLEPITQKDSVEKLDDTSDDILELEQGASIIVEEDNITAELGFRHEVNFYRKFLTTKIDFVLEPYFNLEIKIGMEQNIDIANHLSDKKKNDIEKSLGKIKIPTSVPSIFIEFEPKLQISLEGCITLSAEISKKFGFSYSSKEGFQNYSDDDEILNTSVCLTGTVKAGIAFEPKCVFFSSKIASVGLEAFIGVEVEAELDVNDVAENLEDHGKVMSISSDEESVHGCICCVQGVVNGIFEASVEIDMELLDISLKETLIIAKIKIGEFHISIIPEFEIGRGECTKLTYRNKFIIVDSETGNTIPNAQVVINGITSNSDSGYPVLYCMNGSYTYSVLVNGKEASTGSFTVNNSARDITIELKNTLTSDGTEYKQSSRSEETKPPVTKQKVTVTTKKRTPTLVTIPKSEEFQYSSAGKLGDNIDYILYKDGYMYINGYGEMYDFTSSPLGSKASTVKQVLIDNRDEKDNLVITNIGNNVFKNCSNLEYVYMPKTIESIGNNAFYDCSSLAAFRYDGENDKTTDMILPEKLTELGSYAFSGCSSMSSLTFNDKLTYIPTYAFSNCNGLTEIVVPNTIESIGNYAYSGCSNLKTATISEGVVNIGNYVFDKCIALESLTLPYAGYSLSSVNEEDSACCLSHLFHESVSGATYSADSHHVPNSLKTITITGGSRIPSNAFYGLSSLTEINLPDDIKTFGKNSFCGCASLPKIDLPTSLVSIGDSAFVGCNKFTEIKFPTTFKNIGNRAFANCLGFTSLTIPETIESIGNYAYSGCSNLKTATISEGVVNIGNYVFDKCIALESLTLPYAGYSLSSVNEEDSACCLSHLFHESVSGATYSADSHHVPNSLKTITITGGSRIPSNAFYGFDNLRAIFVNPEVQFAKDSFGHNENCIIAGYADSTAQAYADANKIEFQLISMITSEPKNIESEAGKKVVFTVDAIGNELKYQWQWYNPKTNEWQNSSFDGNKSKKLSVEATTARNGYKYRCVITDSYGNEMISDCVTLSIVSPTSSATLVGDANCDGKVSIADSTAILQSLGNPDKYKLSEQGAVNADVDGNKGITISDSIVIKYYDFKIISKFPVEP